MSLMRIYIRHKGNCTIILFAASLAVLMTVSIRMWQNANNEKINALRVSHQSQQVDSPESPKLEETLRYENQQNKDEKAIIPPNRPVKEPVRPAEEPKKPNDSKSKESDSSKSTSAESREPKRVKQEETESSKSSSAEIKKPRIDIKEDTDTSKSAEIKEQRNDNKEDADSSKSNSAEIRRSNVDNRDSHSDTQLNRISQPDRPTGQVSPATKPPWILHVDHDEQMERIDDKTVTGMRRRLPHAILIGPESCGAKMFLFYLQTHPDISTSNSDVSFFALDSMYKLGYNWYRKQMPFSKLDHVTIARGNILWHTPEAPARISAMNKDIKLIVNVCDPTRRLLRWYTWEVGRAIREKRKPPVFEDIVFDKAEGDINDDHRFIKSGKYTENLRRWYEFFGVNQLYFIHADDLKYEVVKTLQNIEKFLGLENKLTSANIKYDSDRGACRVISGKTECEPQPSGLRAIKPEVNVDPDVVAKVNDWFSSQNKEFYELTGQKIINDK